MTDDRPREERLPSIPAYAPRYTCPHIDCDGQIELTQRVYWSMDQVTGEVHRVLDEAGTYDFSIYCSNGHELATYDGTPPDLTEHLRKLSRDTRWACCMSSIGPPCQHRQYR